MRICVFGAASFTIDEEYVNLVEKMGEELAKRGHSLVFGGGGTGLMGAAARGVHKGKGHILGVIPKFFKDENIESIFPNCSEIILPETMRERKQIMEDNADAFIVVPGGIGTFEEFFEILTLKQLCRHHKPIVIYNINGYYNDIVNLMNTSISKNFVREKCLQLYTVTDDLEELFKVIEAPVVPIDTVSELKFS